MKLLSLDVGEKRIGLAKADDGVKIAVPVGMIAVDGREIPAIIKICNLQNTDIIVVGMPRNLQGQLTQQSDYVKNFVKNLNKALLAEKPNNKTVKIFFQDESLTSVQAKQNLKNRPVNKKSGEIDAEAAALILQDFLENLARRTGEEMPRRTVAAETSAPPSVQLEATELVPAEPTPSKELKPRFKTPKEKTVHKRLAVRIFIIVIAVIGLAFSGALIWYNSAISSVISADKCTSASSADTDPCASVQFTIEDGATVASIADSLKKANLIKSPLAFKVYAKLSGKSGGLKAGNYNLAPNMPVEKIYNKFIEGTNDAAVFRLTILPGETLSDIRKRLLSIGYTAEEIDAALAKKYDHPVLVSKPANASLEGYLFGETYEFYQSDSVETIVVRMLDELYSVVKENNLIQKFENLGYTLHNGITLASVVQKEAGTMSETDQRIVAQVFWTRLANGIALGSDVTATYAANQIDPERRIYTDNATVLDVDSCYNTRKYAGLPCGPISNPGASVLVSTANPADTSYLYFLTGDDGLMYYSNTEAEHLQNRDQHCQNLCNTQL